MKTRLMDKLHLLKPIFQMVAAVHHGSTTKYIPNEWERRPGVEGDSSALCNLDAILRHTTKICNLEYYENQSGLPHVAHVMCRTQMAITGILRGNGDYYNSNFPIELQQSIVHVELKLDPSVGKYLTPEFISCCMQLPGAELKSDQLGYDQLDQYSTHRTWLAIYTNLLLSDTSQFVFCHCLLLRSVQYALHCSITTPALLESCRKVLDLPDEVHDLSLNWMLGLAIGEADVKQGNSSTELTTHV